MATGKKSKVIKQAEATPQKAPPAQRRAYRELAGAKPRMFRASPDVADLLDREVVATGRTQSAVIDEGLRRVFWNEANYTETLMRNFGGRDFFALAFLLARMASGITHLMRLDRRADGEVGAQIARASGQVFLSFLPGGDKQSAQFLKSADGVAAEFSSPQPDKSETWLVVLTTIDRNLRETGDRMWWPLSDEHEEPNPRLAPHFPLRPSMADLRKIWNWHAPGHHADEVA